MGACKPAQPHGCRTLDPLTDHRQPTDLRRVPWAGSTCQLSLLSYLHRDWPSPVVQTHPRPCTQYKYRVTLMLNRAGPRVKQKPGGWPSIISFRIADFSVTGLVQLQPWGLPFTAAGVHRPPKDCRPNPIPRLGVSSTAFLHAVRQQQIVPGGQQFKSFRNRPNESMPG